MGHKVVLRQQERLEQQGRVTTGSTQKQGHTVSRQQQQMRRDTTLSNTKKYAAPRQEYIPQERDEQCDDEDNYVHHTEEDDDVCGIVPEDMDDSDDDLQDKCGEIQTSKVQTSKLVIALQEKENLAKQAYTNFCGKIGTMDNETMLQESVRKVTRKQAWKNFKLVDEDDYQHNSSFALFIFKSLGVEKQSISSELQRQELWLKFKKYVCEGMQAARSSATQAIKKNFIGKWSYRM
jgi:hypothetical protein